MSAEEDDVIEIQPKTQEIPTEKKRPCPPLWRPGYIEFLPCYHRWQRYEGVKPFDPLCPVHWEMGPSERSYDLSMPLKRNMIWLWINFARMMEPRRREWLRRLLIEYYKFDPCDLDRMLEKVEEEERMRKIREEAGPFDVIKPDKLIEIKNEEGKQHDGGDGDDDDDDGGKKKKKKTKKQKKKFKNTHEAMRDVNSKVFQMLSGSVDEIYLSRAAEYFDVQAHLILDTVCKLLEMIAPHATRPSKSGSFIALACMNISLWLAKNITTPASAIPDGKVAAFLKLQGKLPKKKKSKKGKKGKRKKKGKKKKKKGKKVKKDCTKKKEMDDDFFVAPQPIKGWDRKEYPCKIPQKTRIVHHEEEPEEKLRLSLISQHSQIIQDTLRLKQLTNKELFSETYIWYNPEMPEFMYNGKRLFPEYLFTFHEKNGVEKRWSINGMRTGTQNFIPEHVPVYYPQLRPLRLCLYAEGSPQQPWYIMATPYTYEHVQTDFYYWGCPEMIEQMEILIDIYNVMTSTPNVKIEYQIEMLRKFKEAVDCAKLDLDETPGYIKVIHDKYQIIIERLIMKGIGNVLKDYDEESPELLRVLCSQAALYVNLLYAETSRELWDIQSSGVHTPSARSTPVLVDDPDSTLAWNTWMKWLMDLAEIGENWAGWLGNEAEIARHGIAPDTVDDIKEKADGYCWSVCDLLSDADDYLQRAESLQSLRYRKFPTNLHDDKWTGGPSDSLELSSQFSAAVNEE